MTRKKIKIGVLIILSLSLFVWLFASPFWKYSDWSDGNYYVIDIMGDGSNDLVYKLSYNTSIGRVSGVKKIGSNEEFIIAKDTKNQYWILNKEKDDQYLNGSDISQGPFTESEFQVQLERLKISELEFQKTIE